MRFAGSCRANIVMYVLCLQLLGMLLTVVVGGALHAMLRTRGPCKLGGDMLPCYNALTL